MAADTSIQRTVWPFPKFPLADCKLSRNTFRQITALFLENFQIFPTPKKRPRHLRVPNISDVGSYPKISIPNPTSGPKKREGHRKNH